MNVLFHAHSGVRYLVLLIGLMVALHAAIRMVRGRPFDETARRFGVAFAVTMDVQLVLGLVLLFLWPFDPQLIGHITMMVLAVAVAHLAPALNRRRPPERKSLGLQLFGTVGALVLVIGGILAIQRPIL